MDIIHIPPSLVLGCNNQVSANALCDFVEETTGHPLDLMQSGFCNGDKDNHGAGYGYGYPHGCGYGDGYGAGYGSGRGYGSGYGDSQFFGNGSGCGYNYGEFDGSGSGLWATMVMTTTIN